MRRAGSGSERSSRAPILEIVDRLTVLGLQVGGGLFGLLTIYMLWGVITGTPPKSLYPGEIGMKAALHNIWLADDILVVSGIILLLSLTIRNWAEEVAGYILLIAGAVLRWGIPWATGISLDIGSINAASLPAHVAIQYSSIGTVALALAPVFIAADVWQRLVGTRRKVRRGAVVVSKEEIVAVRCPYFCWQTAHCRTSVKRVCSPYRRRKSCWRLKTGCYCDEEKLIRLLNRIPSAEPEGQAQVRPVPPVSKVAALSPAEKRQRCRQCFMYLEHQELKYRMLSPLAFPIALGVMWLWFKPLKSSLHHALQLADKLAAEMSYLPHPSQPLANDWLNVPAASNGVEWLFIVCLGLVVITYTLRALEFLIFDLKV